MSAKGIAIVVMLVLGSIWDIREKKIPGELLVLDTFVGGLAVILDRSVEWKTEWYLYAIGSLIGVMILLVSKFCGGCIGTADGIILMIIGGMIGYRDTLLLLMIAVMIAAVCSVFLIVLQKAGRKTTIPFFPFMLLGYLIMIGGKL